jgi:small subunit ribosomal protein S19e
MDVRAQDGTEIINALSVELKNIPECKAPEWSAFVKTGVSKVRPPTNLDWWYTRSASLLRKIALYGPIGVNKLRRKYGGKHRRGYKPAVFEKGSGKIIRVSLQQLEKAGLIKQTVVDGHKGRILDTKGVKLIAKSAKSLRGAVDGPQ